MPLLKKNLVIIDGSFENHQRFKNCFFHMSNYSVNAVLIEVISWFFPNNFVYNFDFQCYIHCIIQAHSIFLMHSCLQNLHARMICNTCSCFGVGYMQLLGNSFKPRSSFMKFRIKHHGKLLRTLSQNLEFKRHQ